MDHITGDSVICIEFSGNKIFAGTNCGVFVSTDSGESWSGKGLKEITVYSLAAGGTKLFDGAGPTRLFASTDGGRS